MTDSILVKAGYFRPSELAYRLFTVSFCLVILLLALPALIVISLMVTFQDRGPVFYKGARMGKNKKLFVMYKFRTMVPDAEKIIGAEIFSRNLETGQRLLTKTGQFLRDTRLDELPQLFNVLRGDMDLLGPRPLRPAIYEKFCSGIKGFDRRFNVKPGLFGFSQLFTPHSSPKRIRNLIDNRFLKVRNKYTVEMVLVTYAFAMLFFRFVKKLGETIVMSAGGALRGRVEQRRFPRKRSRNIDVAVDRSSPATGDANSFTLLKDINEEAFCFYSSSEISGESVSFTLSANIERGEKAHPVRKRARCTGSIYRQFPSDIDGFAYCYVVKYLPVSPFNSYIVHQYFLEESII